jgi:hypothetical protein
VAEEDRGGGHPFSFSVTLGGIPFALETSAGCMLAGIIFSFLRTRNPALGGPMSEGARIFFVQDIGTCNRAGRHSKAISGEKNLRRIAE